MEELRFEAGHAYDRGHYDHAYRLQAAANLVETLGHSRQEASKSWQKGYEIGLTTEASSYVAGDIVDIIDLAKPYRKKFKALSVTGPRSKALAQKAQKHRRFFADLAESLSVDSLKASRRYTRVVQLQNSSGHGVDIMAKNAKTGRWEAFEIKSTTSADGRFELSAAQAKGSEAYSRDRLRMIAEGSDPEKAAEARKILRESSGYDIEGTVVEVNFFDGSVRSRQWMEQPKKSE